MHSMIQGPGTPSGRYATQAARFPLFDTPQQAHDLLALATFRTDGDPARFELGILEA